MRTSQQISTELVWPFAARPQARERVPVLIIAKDRIHARSRDTPSTSGRSVSDRGSSGSFGGLLVFFFCVFCVKVQV